jgi:hypothetical protein
MCKYTPYTVIYKECEQVPTHTEERNYWEYCADIPGTDTHCPDATRDDTRVVGSSRVTGDCLVCAAAQEEVDKEVEETVNDAVEEKSKRTNGKLR